MPAFRPSNQRPFLYATPAKLPTIFGHPGMEVVNHIAANSKGLKLLHGPPPPTIPECEACARAKSHVGNIKTKRLSASTPYGQMTMDVVQFNEAYNGHQWMIQMVDMSTGIHFVDTDLNENQSVVCRSVNRLVTHLARIGRRIYVFGTDGHKAYGNQFQSILRDHHISHEVSPPYDHALNQSKRAGGVIVRMARTMMIHSSLPDQMWPEAIVAAAYILNRLPVQSRGYKTPFELATGRKPWTGHLRHRIWIPSKNEVVTSRSVQFNESLFYSPNELDLGHVETQLHDHFEFELASELPQEYTELEEATLSPTQAPHQAEPEGPSPTKSLRRLSAKVKANKKAAEAKAARVQEAIKRAAEVQAAKDAEIQAIKQAAEAKAIKQAPEVQAAMDSEAQTNRVKIFSSAVMNPRFEDWLFDGSTSSITPSEETIFKVARNLDEFKVWYEIFYSHQKAEAKQLKAQRKVAGRESGVEGRAAFAYKKTAGVRG
ncbi:hypothetical protein TI39_contig4157g00003 [Zymoseptoria brevis]|uniref:Integrase catalytic domain-containing protein n=1 Tax=Zymoseptoria brevis TaxID=1047168 RepID=A0A0F4GCT2_9PEZI|nr:hypothetical protein TI39_contig4157g00003 [Zymoseptoria brevis]